MFSDGDSSLTEFSSSSEDQSYRAVAKKTPRKKGEYTLRGALKAARTSTYSAKHLYGNVAPPFLARPFLNEVWCVCHRPDHRQHYRLGSRVSKRCVKARLPGIVGAVVCRKFRRQSSTNRQPHSPQCTRTMHMVRDRGKAPCDACLSFIMSGICIKSLRAKLVSSTRRCLARNKANRPH